MQSSDKTTDIKEIILERTEELKTRI